MSSSLSVPDRPAAELLPATSCLLYRLGVTENYVGFQYAAYAAALCALEPDRLLLVTKLLYPDVARHFGTSWHAVERGLRTVVRIAWSCNAPYLSLLSDAPLVQKPCAARFLAILSHALSPSA